MKHYIIHGLSMVVIVLMCILMFNTCQQKNDVQEQNKELEQDLKDCRDTVKAVQGPGSRDTIIDTIQTIIRDTADMDIPEPTSTLPAPEVPYTEDTMAAESAPFLCDSLRTYDLPYRDSSIVMDSEIKVIGRLQNYSFNYEIKQESIERTVTETKVIRDTTKEVEQEKFQVFFTAGIGSELREQAPDLGALNVGAMAMIGKYGIGYEYGALRGIHQLKLAIKLD